MQVHGPCANKRTSHKAKRNNGKIQGHLKTNQNENQKNQPN